ncbi:MAG TPA: hypothetical protein PLB25_10555 [Rhodoferax sp.]|nr:hypothetical protein [Rhodoferax sp.]
MRISFVPTLDQMNEIALLLCGDNSEGTGKIALDQLASSLRSFSAKAATFLTEDITDEALSFGPFCSRVLLENGCAALVGRLDSFRMLYLSEFQAQPEYEPGKRAKSAFAWSGDVIPDEKPNQALWSIDHDLPKISRALFSKYFEHIFWKPAINRMLDYVSSLESDPLLADVANIDPDRFIDETKGRSIQLYSTLSKGVHWEFFTSALLFDEATVKNSIRETFLLVANLGLVSHFVHTAYASLAPDEAARCYKAIRRLVP